MPTSLSKIVLELARILRRRTPSSLWVLVLGPAFYFAIAIVITWPLAKNASSLVVIGTEPASTVPLFNIWTIWWNADRFLQGFSDYWNAPIFFPEKNTFAFSEPQPASIIVAPIVWASDSRALAMNVYLWLSLALNGWMAERCLSSVRTTRWLSVGGGAAMMVLPIVHWQIGVMQLVPMWGTLWVWWATVRLCQNATNLASWKRSLLLGAEIGAAMSCTWYCCVHHGLSLGLLMLVGGWVLGKRLFQLKTIASLSLAVLTFAILSGPFILHLAQMASNEDFRRTQEMVARLSAMPSDYLNTYGHSIIDLPNRNGREGWMMSPGVITYVVAVFGAVAGFRRSKRSLTLLLILMTLSSYLLSLGANLQILRWKPWWTLVEYAPGFAQVRNVFRFGYFFQAAVVLMATIGLDAAWSFLQQYLAKENKNRLRLANIGPMVGIRFCQAAIVLISFAAWVDPWPPRIRLTEVPAHATTEDAPEGRNWINELAANIENSADERAVLCLPMAAGGQVIDYEITAQWMLASTFHHRPLANGYSGFFPDRYFSLRGAIAASGIDADVLEYLIEAGILTIVIDRRQYATWWGKDQRIGQVEVTRAFGDGSKIDVYKITKLGREEGG